MIYTNEDLHPILLPPPLPIPPSPYLCLTKSDPQVVIMKVLFEVFLRIIEAKKNQVAL